MAIVYMENGDVDALIVVCDVCGKRIEDAHNGAVLGHGGHEIKFVHKGRCDDAFQAAHPEYGSAWDELADFPMFLALNTGVDLRSLPKRAEDLHRFGFTN